MGDQLIAYGTSAAITAGVEALATSLTLVAGWESAEFDNTTTKFLDVLLGGKITTGTTPTVGKRIEIWIIPKSDDSNWPDVFDGSNSAETVTSREVLSSCGFLFATLIVTATSNVAYPFWGSVSAALGGPLPKKFSVFVVHDTAVNLNATGGNQVIAATGVYTTIA